MLKTLLMLSISIYALLGISLYIFQRSFIYFPVAFASAANLTEVTVVANGYRLQGFVANSGKPQVAFYFVVMPNKLPIPYRSYLKNFRPLPLLVFIIEGMVIARVNRAK